MEGLINIGAWLILVMLCSIVPGRLEISRQRHWVTPTVVYTIIILNTLIYLVMILVNFFGNHSFYNSVVLLLGCRPYDILHPLSAGGIIELLGRYATLITYQFIHGGFLHLLGNMTCLYVFGPGVEMGQNIRFSGRERRVFNSFLPFIVFYLFCGIGSALCHIGYFGFGANKMGVLIGASGAISGVLAASLLGLWKDYKKITVYVLYYFPFRISVNFYILYWILLQFALFIATGDKSSVSYAGHIGGFITGLLFWTFVCPWAGIIVSAKARGWFRKYRTSG